MWEKGKGTIKCDKRIVTCDAETTQCGDGTVKCEDLVIWSNKFLTSEYYTQKNGRYGRITQMIYQNTKK